MPIKVDVFKGDSWYSYKLNDQSLGTIDDTPENITRIQQTYDALDSLCHRLPSVEFTFHTSRLPDDDPVRLYVDHKEAVRLYNVPGLQMMCVFAIRLAMRNKCDESFYSLGLPLVHLVTYEHIAKELGFIKG